MNALAPVWKLAAVASSLLLMACYIAFQGGAFDSRNDLRVGANDAPPEGAEFLPGSASGNLVFPLIELPSESTETSSSSAWVPPEAAKMPWGHFKSMLAPEPNADASQIVINPFTLSASGLCEISVPASGSISVAKELPPPVPVPVLMSGSKSGTVFSYQTSPTYTIIQTNPKLLMGSKSAPVFTPPSPFESQMQMNAALAKIPRSMPESHFDLVDFLKRTDNGDTSSSWQPGAAALSMPLLKPASIVIPPAANLPKPPAFLPGSKSSEIARPGGSQQQP